MNEDISNKLDELIYTINNNEDVKELKKLKKEIYSDLGLKKDLDSYRSQFNEYSNDVVSLKSKIVNNDLVKRYRELENKLYFTVLDMNKLLNEIIKKGSCNR